LVQLLLSGQMVRATDTVGWLVDYAGPLEDCLKTAWAIATDGEHKLSKRSVKEGALNGIPTDVSALSPPDSPFTDAARSAIMACIQEACHTPLSEAIAVQARHSADFMTTSPCRKGAVGADRTKTMTV
jgi:hypothetical protein